VAAVVVEMGIDISWHSQAGKRTKDNRDCGGVGIRAGEALCIVLDGSTTAPNSGALAWQLVREMVDWYVVYDEAITTESLIARLRQSHGTLSRQYPQASASYMIVHIQSQVAILGLHAGDCLLGRRDGTDKIKWLNQPHTLANATELISVATIAGLPTRHRLTRSFRAREFTPPDAVTLKIEKELVVATDGFWAELNAQEQARFLGGQSVPMPIDGDDRSALRIRLHNTGTGVRYDEKNTDGFYKKTRS
jgi:serine/threonine protein phosphatase PrpC